VLAHTLHIATGYRINAGSVREDPIWTRLCVVDHGPVACGMHGRVLLVTCIDDISPLVAEILAARVSGAVGLKHRNRETALAI